jgi:hypothetical protein
VQIREKSKTGARAAMIDVRFLPQTDENDPKTAPKLDQSCTQNHRKTPKIGSKSAQIGSKSCGWALAKLQIQEILMFLHPNPREN